MSTLVAPDVDSVALEDIAPGCTFDTKGKGCDHTAEWVMVAQCGCMYVFCTPHKERSTAILDGLPADTVCTCMQCDAKVVGFPWKLVERL